MKGIDIKATGAGSWLLIKTETENLSFDLLKRNYDANQRYYLKIINARTEREIDSREVLLDLPEMEY